MRLLLKHANLIIDGNKSFEDGALLINGEHIEEVFPHSNKIKYDLKNAESIDLHGLTVIPEFYKEDISKKYVLDPLNSESMLLADRFRNKCRIMLGDTKAMAKDVMNLEYDGFYNLYENMNGFNHRELSLVNLAFYQRDKYVELNPDIMDASVLKLTVDNLRRDRVIFIGNPVSGMQKLRSLHYSFNDVLMFCSLNGFTFYDDSRLNGSLVKGKFANMLVIDETNSIKFRFHKGKLYV